MKWCDDIVEDILEKPKNRGIELIIDSMLLSSCAPDHLKFEELDISNIENSNMKYYELLFKSFYQIVNLEINQEAYLGSYLSSRLILKGFHLKFENYYLYELADAIRTSSLINANRLFHILQALLRSMNIKEPVSVFLQQSYNYIDTLNRLTIDKDLMWEMKLLNHYVDKRR
jgi:hypothetical protein